MAKGLKLKYVCNVCGNTTTSWAGKCLNCGEWNSIEELVSTSSENVKTSGIKLTTTTLSKATTSKNNRIKTSMPGIDQLLGGGLVEGSVVLLAGQPGIGKSTLLLQVANSIAKTSNVIYVTGEESGRQVGLRAERLKAKAKNINLAVSSSANDISATIAEKKYSVAIVDSIQSVAVNEIASATGSVSQIVNSTRLLIEAAKSSGTAVIIVGHVTKEGSIAGPKVLEHLVDVVLQFEGDNFGGFKLLRSSKNRYGSTAESAIMQMSEAGLEEVSNPSKALLAERQITDGSIVHAAMEGSRAILVEIQALVNPTSYGYPKRTSSGFDLNRLNLLIAVLERRTKLKLAEKDIFVNVVGGIKLTEPAADLAICMAIASAAKGMQLKKNAVVFGEVGLSGEIRHVPFSDRRVAEASKLGFKNTIGPKSQSNSLPKGLQQVSSLRDALNTYLESD